jgi:hypothetical protein
MARTRALLRAKTSAASLDGARKLELRRAVEAYEAYVQAQGSYAFEVYIGTAARNGIASHRRQQLFDAETKALERFPRFVATDADDAAVARAESAMTAALRGVETSTPGEERALAETQRTWLVYREAEMDLHRDVFGRAQGTARVLRTLLIDLANQRATECSLPPLTHE